MGGEGGEKGEWKPGAEEDGFAAEPAATEAEEDAPSAQRLAKMENAREETEGAEDGGGEEELRAERRRETKKTRPK